MFKQLSITIAALLLAAVSANPYWRSPHYISQFEKEMANRNTTERANQHEQLYVHLIAHTHDDVGWLKTVDQYYTGSDQGDAIAEVNMILSTVVQELIENPHRKFTYVEMKFFTMWYWEQPEHIKDALKQLIKEGRFEFVNAGWSMHDEACPHFEDMINNMMHGHQFLLREFGVKPRIGWHIDPFGHSNANPRLFADMGFEAWFFARLDHADRDQRLNTSSMNYLWRPFAEHFGNQKQIFTGAMRDHYCWPQGFWYDERFWNDDPFVTNKERDTYNAENKTRDLQKYLNEMAANYLGNHMLVPFGCDFSFANAKLNFQNMDRLIEYFNEHNTANITLFYSTPGEYLDALHAQNLTWPVKYDDMFPYSDNPQDYWTGYFTSRQAAKKQVRDGQTNLHASNFLYAMKAIQEGTSEDEMREIMDAKDGVLDWMGVYQHHDAVAGTAKQYVADNYVVHLSREMANNNKVYGKLIREQIKNDLNLTIDAQTTFFNGYQNDTVAETPMGTMFKNAQDVLIAVHNPSSKFTYEPIEIQVPNSAYAVQVYCMKTKQFYDITSKCSTMRQHHRLNDGNETVDYKLLIPYKLFPNQVGYVKLHQMCDEEIADMKKLEEVAEMIKKEKGETKDKANKFNASLDVIESDTVPLKFKFTKNYTDGNSTHTLEQTFGVNLGFYAASDGHDKYNGSNAPGGAYLFKPSRYNQTQFQYAQRTVQKIDYQYSEPTDTYQWTFDFHNKNKSESAILRVIYQPRMSEIIKFDLELNGISIDDGIGKDVTINWKFDDFEDGEQFWTDSNGLEMQKRVKDDRFSFKLDKSGMQNASWNYYPVNSAIAMRNIEKNGSSPNQGVQVTVMNERSQAGSATIEKGMIEIIHNRRLLFDDDRGVGEALNETDAQGFGMKVNARYWLNIFDLAHGHSAQRPIQNHIDKPHSLFFAEIKKDDITEKKLMSTNEPVVVPLNMSDLVDDSKMFELFGRVVMFPLDRNVLLVRLQNTADKFDMVAPELTLDMEKMAQGLWYSANPRSKLQPHEVNARIQELSLSANMPEEEVMARRKHMQWRGQDDEAVLEKLAKDEALKAVYETTHADDPMSAMTLVPQAIRTFVIDYNHHPDDSANNFVF